MLYREHGQGTIEELQNRDFRKDLEEKEREKEKNIRGRIQDNQQLVTHFYKIFFKLVNYCNTVES